MANISYVEKDHASAEVQQTYAQIEQTFGLLPNFFKAMGHSPSGTAAVWGFFSNVIPAWKLDPRLLELAYIKSCDLNGCHY